MRDTDTTLMEIQLEKKVNRAISLIQAAGKIAKEHGQLLEICYSGGKDSDVILELARMADVDYRAIYKLTTIDPPGTIQHAKDRGVTDIIHPKKNFGQLIAEHGYPSRWVRHCCKYLKEYKVLDYAVVGVRREESTRRAKMYKEPEVCRYYGSGKPPKKTKKNAHKFVRQYYPLLDWTTKDVADFLQERSVKCAPVYYDEQGNFHPERRLGCMCCPLANDNLRLEEFKRYPNMVKLYVNKGGQWIDSHKQATLAWVQDKYDMFYALVFCKSKADWQTLRNGLFGKPDTKKLIEDYFGIKFKD